MVIGLFLFASVSVADPVPRAAVGEGEGAGGGANVRAVGAPFPQLIPKSHQSAVHLQRNLAGLTYK